MVTIQSGYHGPQFWETHGTTYRGVVSYTLFNVVVDSVVRHCILLTFQYGSVVPGGLGHIVGWVLGVFYVDYELLVYLYP